MTTKPDAPKLPEYLLERVSKAQRKQDAGEKLTQAEQNALEVAEHWEWLQAVPKTLFERMTGRKL